MADFSVVNFEGKFVFFGFCPGADFSKRLDTRWKELGICEFHYFGSATQVKRFASIVPGDLVVLKKRQVIGKTMRLYGFGLVTAIDFDEHGSRVLKVDWSKQERVIEVPLMGCNATIDIRGKERVIAEMPADFFAWLSESPEPIATAPSTRQPVQSAGISKATDCATGRIDANVPEQDLLTSASTGDVLAMESLGTAYAIGQWGPADSAAAYHWFMRAAELGSERGMFFAAHHLLEGRGVAQNAPMALFFLRKLSSGSQFSADANHKLGLMYEKGLGVTQDLQRARQFYETAARLGSAQAVSQLSMMGGSTTAEEPVNKQGPTVCAGTRQIRDYRSGHIRRLDDNQPNEDESSQSHAGVEDAVSSGPSLLMDRKEDIQVLVFSFLWVGNHVGESTGRMSVDERMAALRRSAEIFMAAATNSDDSSSQLFVETYMQVAGDSAPQLLDAYDADTRTTKQGFDDLLEVLVDFSARNGMQALQQARFFLNSLAAMAQAAVDETSVDQDERSVRLGAADYIKRLWF